MNKEVKQKWVEALRSGKYEQGYGQLRNDNQYCCLGVLCDLHSKETGTPWRNGKYLVSHYTLSKAVVDWAGLNVFDPCVGAGNTLTEYNDDLGYNFEQIAELIDEDL